MAKIAFVTPRYGDGVLGGSESRVREEARGLAKRGHEVEVLTTCARDHHTWQNVWPAGLGTDGGVTVRRFETIPRSDPVVWSALERRIFAGDRLTDEDELAWVNARFRVPELYLYLAETAREYDALVFSPYLFWTTLYCIGIAPERSILMPCLHDEPYAYLRSVRAALAGSAEVWFQSEPEHQLGHRLAPLPSHRVIGSAVHVPEQYDPAGFRERHGLERPFVLCAGRREEGKGWPQAMRGFAAALVRHGLQLDLVTVGAGDPEIPPALRERIIDLGYLDDGEVANAFAAAEAYLQPSPNESFSRTIMEAWLASTVVIANMASEVVAWHCERSGGGLVYGDEIEMGECLRLVAEAPKLASELAGRGREYVLSNYTWPKILDGMEVALERFSS
ncbi:MAG TPA: glycosyltransferase family 4 protein [Acidimicrobiales bacterium]|nr:glycosyltransferase family 4 protein [Acidimicrobiales bacterium]